MPDRPSIKGTVLVDLIEDLKKLRDAGEIPEREFQRRLRPQDLELLEAPVNATGWYDVEFYRRASELLRDAIGAGDDRFLHRRGYERGIKLAQAGLYQQLEYAGRAQVQQHEDSSRRFDAYGRDLRLLVTLSGSILSFSRWTVEVDPEHPDRYRITVDDAAAYPEPLGYATEGLIDSLASRHGMPDLWRFERTSPTQIVFRMKRGL